MKLSRALFKSQEQKEREELDLKWANAIKTRDGWACVICGSIYSPNAHHIIPREIITYRHDLNNGITLCRKHHKFCRNISAHNNPLAFFLWLERYKTNLFFIARGHIQELLKGEVAI